VRDVEVPGLVDGVTQRQPSACVGGLIEVVLSDGDYELDTENSSITWIGRKVLGEHNGKISIQSGTILVQDGMLQGGDISVDMQSITCNDLTDPQSNERLVNHLKSDDFFGAETYPTARLVVTDVESINTGASVTADLTIKENTHPVTFDVTFSETDGKLQAEGTLVFDRSLYDVRYRSNTFFDDLGDKAIYNDVELQFNLVTR